MSCHIGAEHVNSVATRAIEVLDLQTPHAFERIFDLQHLDLLTMTGRLCRLCASFSTVFVGFSLVF